jgi:hypothetical protein
MRLGRRGLRLPAALFFPVAALLLAACSDDDPPATVGTLAGRVESLPNHEPMAGVRVILLDPSTNDAAAPPVTTDAEGRYALEDLTPGFYHPIAEAGPMLLYAPFDQAVRIDAGRRATLDFALAPYPGLEGSGRPVHGIVRDADTGQPIEGAWVSAGFTDPGFLIGNGMPPWESRTGPDGRFALAGVPFVSLGDGRTGLYPIVAMDRDHRPGATGSLVRGEILPILPASGPPLDVDIRLAPGPGERTIAGRVVHRGLAVAGVPVALTLADIDDGVEPVPSGPAGTFDPARAPAGSVPSAPGLAPRALVPGAVQVTDASGGFSFDALAPGRYRVHAAYFPDDGWVPAGLGSGAPPAVRVGADDVTGLEIAVVPAIRLVAPARLELVETVRPRLSWRPLAGIQSYTVLFSRANSFFLNQNQLVADSAYVLPPGYFRAGDQGRWAVQAYENGTLVASSEYVSTFTIGER